MVYSSSGKKLPPKQRAIIEAIKRELYKSNPPWIVDSGHADAEVSQKEINLDSSENSNYSVIPLWVMETAV